LQWKDDTPASPAVAGEVPGSLVPTSGAPASMLAAPCVVASGTGLAGPLRASSFALDVPDSAAMPESGPAGEADDAEHAANPATALADQAAERSDRHATVVVRQVDNVCLGLLVVSGQDRCHGDGAAESTVEPLADGYRGSRAAEILRCFAKRRLCLLGMGVARAGLLGTAVFGAQLTVSAWWLRHFRFGPVEWVWRWVTYQARPPLRR
jgi:hypothetical protein